MAEEHGAALQGAGEGAVSELRDGGAAKGRTFRCAVGVRFICCFIPSPTISRQGILPVDILCRWLKLAPNQNKPFAAQLKLRPFTN